MGGIAKDSDYRRIGEAAWKFRLGERAESRHWQNLKWQNLIAREIKIKLILKSVSLSDYEYGCDRVNQSASKGMSGCGSHSGVVALHQTSPSLYPLP